MQPSSCYVEIAVESEDDSANEKQVPEDHTEGMQDCISETQPVGQ